MASADVSSESDDYEDRQKFPSRGRTHSRRFLPSPPRNSQGLSAKVDNLTDTLQDTTRNLRAVDHMLGQYKDVNAQKTSAIDKLRQELSMTTQNLQSERARHSRLKDSDTMHSSDLDGYSTRSRTRYPTSPLKDYRSHSDAESRRRSRHPRRRSRSAVRFAEYADRDDDDLHELHRSVRDLNTSQARLEDDLNHEISRRTRHEIDQSRSMESLRSSLASRPPPTDPLTSVDRRLQSLEQELRNKPTPAPRSNDVTKLSTELKQALQQGFSEIQSSQRPPPVHSVPTRSSTAEPREYQRKYLDTEAQKHRVESELETTRRRLDQSEGGKQALETQLEDLRRQLGQSEHERTELKSRLNEQRYSEENTRRKRVPVSDEADSSGSRHQLEREIDALKSQIHVSTAVDRHEDMKRELDRSERQRTQLSDHIEVLSKDVENKEKQVSKLIQQLQETTHLYDTCNRDKEKLLNELQDSLRKLRDVTQQAEKCEADYKNTEKALQESEAKREEIKIRAQETVKQWKVKCKRLERDVDRFKHSAEQLVERNEQLIKDGESTRSQALAGGQHMESLRREMADILSVRAQQDEQLRIKDVEVNELKSVKMDLEKELRDTRSVLDRMELDVKGIQSKFERLEHEKNGLEEQLSRVQAAQLSAQDQLHQYQRDMNEVTVEKADIINKLKDEISTVQELKMELSECRRNEAGLREDLEMYDRQLREEREQQKSAQDSLVKQLEQSKSHEASITQEFTRRIKREKAESEAEIQALKLSLSEDRSSLQLLKRREEKSTAEIEELYDKLQRLEGELAKSERKYQKARHEYELKSSTVEEELDRSRRLEDQLYSMKDANSRLEQDVQKVLHDIDGSVDALTKLTNQNKTATFQNSSIKRSLGDRQKWVADILAKLEWLKSELRFHFEKDRKLRTNVKEVVEATQADREFFTTELNRQNEIIDELANQRKVLSEKENEASEEVSELQEQVVELSVNLDAERQHTQTVEEQADKEKQQLLEDFARLRNSDAERQKIQDRFSRLQETMTSLKQELTETRQPRNLQRDYKRDADSMTSRLASISPTASPKKSRRVQINEKPYIFSDSSYTSPNRQPVSKYNTRGTTSPLKSPPSNDTEVKSLRTRPVLLSQQRRSPLKDSTSRRKNSTNQKHSERVNQRRATSYPYKERYDLDSTIDSLNTTEDSIDSSYVTRKYTRPSSKLYSKDDLSPIMSQSRKVTSPPTLDKPTHGGSRLRSRTPPPLDLNDEEFKKNFYPESPPKILLNDFR